jgi:acetylornithine/N-succinyldiaminopimelate aminotransferase
MTDGLVRRGEAAILPTYPERPLALVRGAGCTVWDEAGAPYLDLVAGLAVCSLGHGHPAPAAALAAQAFRLGHVSNLFWSEPSIALAERLHTLAGFGRVFFCNSGAEANENALLLARRHTGRSAIVSVSGGWHGRTAATLACTDGERYAASARRSGIPLSRKVLLNDVSSLEIALDDTVAAFIVEPVQGLAGALECTPDFLQQARRICRDRGVVLIFDEVQCGIGRCGAFSASEAFGVGPDLITFAKGLGSGLPIAAVMATAEVTSSVVPGDLGSTFGGGPVPCAAALATIDVIRRDGLIENAMEVGAYLEREARMLGIREVSGRGLLLGLHLGRPAAGVQRALFQRRIITGTATDPEILRLLPPLSFSRSEADILLGGLEDALR